MIRENRNLLINAAIALLVGLAFMFTFQTVYPTSKYPAYDKLFKNASKIETISFDKKELVYEVLEVKKGSDILGYIYKGKAQNSYSGEEGYIDIQMGIDSKGKITGIEFLELTQSDFKVEDIKKNAAYYKDKNISELDLSVLANKGPASYDVTADASAGTSIIRGVIREAIIFYTGEEPVEVDPILEVFPTYATAVNDDSFVVTEKVVQKQIIKSAADAIIGHLYKVTSTKNTGALVDYHENEEWTLTFLIGLDLDGKIVKIYTLESNDTPGFYKKHNAYLESLIGKDMLTYDDIENTVTGATFSRGRILELLEALKGVL